MKTKSKTVENWEELIDFINSINYYRDTIILSGFINRLDNDKLKICKLVFDIVPAETLKNINQGINVRVKIRGKQK